MDKNWQEDNHWMFEERFIKLHSDEFTTKYEHNTIIGSHFLRCHVVQKMYDTDGFYFKTKEDFMHYVNKFVLSGGGGGNRYLVLPYDSLIFLDPYSKFIWNLRQFGAMNGLYDNQFQELIERAKRIMVDEIWEMAK